MRLLAPKTHAPVAICLFLALAPALLHPQTPDPPQIPSVQISKQPAPPQRIPREQALTSAALDGTLREQISPSVSRPVAGAQLSLRNMRTNQTITAASTDDGVFRIVPLAPGTYELHVQAVGYTDFAVPALALNANEVLTLEILLAPAMSSVLASRLPRQPELGPSLPAEAVASTTSYREFRHRLDADPNYILELAPDVLPPAADVFSTFPNRSNLPCAIRKPLRPAGSGATKNSWSKPAAPHSTPN